MKKTLDKYQPLSVAIPVFLVCQAMDFIFRGRLHYLLNSKAIFGLALDNQLAIFLSVLLLLLCYVLIKTNSNKMLLALFVGGSMSNIIDRIFYGGVVDYINLFNISIINLADIAIVSSLICISWQFLNKKNI